MPVDEGVVAALEGALERDPDNDALAVHLAQVLLDAGRPADALRRCREVLARDPAHAPARELAAKALDEKPAEPAPPEPEKATVVPLRVVDGGAGDEDD